MRDAAAYQTIAPEADPAEAIGELDWHSANEVTIVEAAALLNQAMADAYDDHDLFLDELTSSGYVASANAGRAMHHALDAAPPESRVEIVYAAIHLNELAEPASRLAYLRQALDGNTDYWSDLDDDCEYQFEMRHGPERYAQLLEARDLLQQSAYLCATPGSHHQGYSTEHLDAARDAHRALTFDDPDQSDPDQSDPNDDPTAWFANVESTLARVNYVVKNHLLDIVDHMWPDQPGYQAAQDIANDLIQSQQERNADKLAASARALYLVAATDGQLEQSELERLQQLAETAQRYAERVQTNAAQFPNDSTEHHNVKDDEVMSYQAVENLLRLGYRSEAALADAISGSDWNQSAQALADLKAAAGAAGSDVIAMTQPSELRDVAHSRYDHLQYTLQERAANDYCSTEARAAMDAIAAQGCAETAAKFDLLLQHSSDLNLLRLGPNHWSTSHASRSPSWNHLQYGNLTASTPDIIADHLLLPGVENATYAEKAELESARMALGMLYETKQALLEQYGGVADLATAAEARNFSARTMNALADYDEATRQHTAELATQWPDPELLKQTAIETAVRLALQYAAGASDETQVLDLLDLAQDPAAQPAAFREAMSLLHPMLQDAIDGAIGAADAVAANWSQPELDEAAVYNTPKLAELDFKRTDGGRAFWMEIENLWGEINDSAGDCSVRALTCALDRNDRYGEIWRELTQAVQEYDNPEKTVESGISIDGLAGTYQQYGLVQIYADSNLPNGNSRRQIDLREIDAALAHLRQQDEEPLVYAMASLNHIVAVSDGTLMDSWDCRDMGDPLKEGRNGRVQAIWLKCDDPARADQFATAVNRYARIRTHCI